MFIVCIHLFAVRQKKIIHFFLEVLAWKGVELGEKLIGRLSGILADACVPHDLLPVDLRHLLSFRKKSFFVFEGEFVLDHIDRLRVSQLRLPGLLVLGARSERE